jgi:hypothetical protein
VTGATIDVQRPPAGWSHLSGPLLHNLVALAADDAQYARAADGGRSRHHRAASSRGGFST